MLELINQYEMLVEDSIEKYKIWESDPSNYELECSCDLACEKEFNMYNFIVNEVAKSTGMGKHRARNVLINYRKELRKIFS